MVKKFKRESGIINLFTVVTLLLTLLISSIGVAHAWFVTSHEKGLQIIMKLGEMKVSLYQKVAGQDVLIKTNKKNATDDEPSYITLEKEEIIPDETNNLILILENDDIGAGTYLRFKFEIFTQKVKYDEASQKYIKDEINIPLNLICGEGVVKSGDYYYYGIADGEGNLTDSTFFEKTSEDPVRLTLMNGFIVPYSSFNLLEGSETVKLVLTIEGSSVKY